MKVASIILNRNLPEITDALCDQITAHNPGLTDVFVVEAGSDETLLSKHCTWWANWDDAMADGLRVPRGFNYALSEMYKNGTFQDYDYYFLMTNDTEFEDYAMISTLLEEMATHRRVGILSPLCRIWGEAALLRDEETKYFSHINHLAWFMRRECIESIANIDSADHLEFLYDGYNFRGYQGDIEVIVKAYANDWAAAITSRVMMCENESYLKTRADLIKTEPFSENNRLYIEEGLRWMRKKYGFNSHWTMQLYTKFFYDQFFVYFPECEKFKI